MVDKDTAEADVNGWLDFRNVKPSKREGVFKELIKSLVGSIMDGDICMDQKFNIIQTLSVPIGTEMTINEFVYKPRIRIEEIKVKTSVDEDAFLYTQSYIAALTGKPISLVKKMDSEDFKIGQTVANFFM